MSAYPLGNYPTILKGFVKGDKLRLECVDGTQLVCAPEDLPQGGWTFRDGGFSFLNFSPVTLSGKLWGVTHLQKYSSWGWLKTDPDCYHRWWFWKTQEQDSMGTWIPGTERGLYFRKPFSWRWQPPEPQKWQWTKGYLGGHWD